MADVYFVLTQVAEAVIGLLSALGNALVLYVIYRHRTLRTITNYFIASLALADFLVGVVGIPCVIVNNFSLPPDFYGCLIMNSSIVVCTQISIFGLVVIAVERFMAIRFPIFHRQRFTSRVAGVIIALSWVFGTIVGIVPVFGWNKGWNPAQICAFIFIIDFDYMVYFNFLGFVFTPLLIIFSTYGYIFHVIRVRSKATSAQAGSDTQKSNLAKESKAAQKIFYVIILFAACWLPIHIMNAITHWFGKTWFPAVIVGVLLSHANSCMNPFLYAYSNIKFREAFKKTLGIKSNRVDVLEQSVNQTAVTQAKY